MGSLIRALEGWVRVLARWLPCLNKDAHQCPWGWDRTVRLQDGREILIRPLRPDDETLYPVFLAHVTPEDRRLRFFMPVREFSPARIAQFTHVDFARAMAFAALERATGELVGVARLHRLAYVYG